MKSNMMECRKRYFMIVVCMFIILVLCTNVWADIVGLWRFEEGTGYVTEDSSGHGHTGYLVAGQDDPNSPAESQPPRWITGQIGNYALEFGTPNDGVPGAGDPNRNWNYVFVDYFGDENADLWEFGTRWSIAFWYNQYTNDPCIHFGPIDDTWGYGYQRMISCPSYEVEAGVPGDENCYFWPDGYESWQSSIGPSKPLNEWHHMALTFDGFTFKRYDDGNEVFSVSRSGELPVDTGEKEYLKLRFGAQDNPVKDYYIGALDDIAVFNECLDASQIATIMTGDFSGAWKPIAWEPEPTSFYVWDHTFFAQHIKYGLAFGEKQPGQSAGNYIPSWNWKVEGFRINPNWFGLVNAGLVDGDANTVELAAYTSVGNPIRQAPVDSGRAKIHKNTKYDLTARFCAEDANSIGAVIGVRFYAATPDRSSQSLIVDFSETITTPQQWYTHSTTFTATEAAFPNDDHQFLVECYVEGDTATYQGKAFGWFDYARVDVNEYLTCESVYDYGYGTLGTDLYRGDSDTNSCGVNLHDYSAVSADNWAVDNRPDLFGTETELITNPDFYDDVNRASTEGRSGGGAPVGWSFAPETNDLHIAGVQDVSRAGRINHASTNDYQPAGGDVAVYINHGTELRQTVSSEAIQSGETYYLSAMLGGSPAYNGTGYLNVVKVIWEYVDNPANPTEVNEITPDEPNLYVLPDNTLAWRKFGTEWTAPPEADGKYFRVRVVYELPPAPFDEYVVPTGYGMIGNISIDTTEPNDWPRENLLTNGDFEDISSLPVGTPGDGAGWINLYDYINNYVEDTIPGWDTSNVDNPSSIYGMQCMFWAPAPQPVRGRVSAYFDGEIAQKVTKETIQDANYYLDFVGCIHSSDWATGWNGEWPDKDPNLVVEVYWTEGDDLGDNHGLITTLKAPVDGALVGGGDYSIPFGSWINPSTNFTPGPEAIGNSFYVVAYTEGLYDVPSSTFEQICLSKEAPPVIEAYTCPDLRVNYGTDMSEDLNKDCVVNIVDLSILLEDWLKCSSFGCP